MVVDSYGRDLGAILQRAAKSASDKRAKYHPTKTEKTQRESELLTKRGIALAWLADDKNKANEALYLKGLKRYEEIEEELKSYEKSTPKGDVDQAIDLFCGGCMTDGILIALITVWEQPYYWRNNENSYGL